MAALDPIVVGREVCSDFARSSKLEWLETNGSGGFAMGTVSGANTRRYHAHLLASLRPPVDRYVLVSKIGEELSAGGGEAALGCNQYPGVVHPAGFQSLREFRLDPFPVWTYEALGVTLEKRLFLVPGRQTAIVRYRASAACRLQARPFLAFRDYHSLTHANDALNRTVEAEDGRVTVRPYPDLPQLTFHHSAGLFEASSGWFYNTEYLEELDRGLDFREDLYSPGALVFDLPAGGEAWIVAGIETNSFDLAAVDELERARRAQPAESRWGAAAEQFLVRRADGQPTVIAGYPWFTDWGRDTMIALPGLLIGRGRLDDARDVIAGFLKFLNQGLIPNRFPDSGEAPEYNTADATLWMFVAVQRYLEAGGDAGFLHGVFYPAAKEIIAWHQRGTHNTIRVDPADGLLSAGGPGTQLTWMDARCGGRAVTPRAGKPVEINALWYNALSTMAEWGRGIGDRDLSLGYGMAAKRVKESFAAFWNEERRCLYDVLTPSGPDAALRPNQILALSLPYPLLRGEPAKAVVRAVESQLLTPMGLRTLAPGEPGYAPRYEGDSDQRDSAYHQGTVWPWLLEPFVIAYLRAFGRSKKSLAYCRGLLDSFDERPAEGCLGCLAEIFDAEPPHQPRGAPAQAWSVAAILSARALLNR